MPGIGLGSRGLGGKGGGGPRALPTRPPDTVCTAEDGGDEVSIRGWGLSGDERGWLTGYNTQNICNTSAKQALHVSLPIDQS